MTKQSIHLLAIGCIFCLLCGCTADAQKEEAVSSEPMPETSVMSTETETPESSIVPETEEQETSNEMEMKKITEGQLVKEIPSLTVVCGGQSVIASGGSSHWYYTEGESGVSIIGCGSHPLDAQDDIPVLEMADGIAALVFTYAPNDWSACCWSDDNWGNTDAESAPAVKTEDGIGLVVESGYIYQIYAEWSAGDNGGDGYYSFYVN